MTAIPDPLEALAAAMQARAAADQACAIAALAKLPPKYRNLVREVAVLAAVRGYQRGLGRPMDDSSGILGDTATTHDVLIASEAHPDLYPGLAKLMRNARPDAG